MRMILFGIAMTVVWGGVHYYVGQRLITGSGLQRPWNLIAWGLVAAHASLSPVVFAVRRGAPESFLLDCLQSIENAPPHDFSVLLAHQPKSCYAASDAGWNLQLSGHTHGGQFYPWNFFVGLAHPFTAGLDKWGDTWVYVNRGTGYWGPPLRLGIPSEVTVLTLRRPTA